jgi:biotin synthase
MGSDARCGLSAAQAMELMGSPLSLLLERAGAAREGLASELASPNLITTACATSPVCRHCKWENMKARESKFAGLRPLAPFLARFKVLEEAGVTRVFMPAGWQGYNVPPYFREYVAAAREATNLPLFLLAGALSRESLVELKDAGLDGIFCGLESPSREAYRWFRPGGDSLDDRIATLEWAKELGLRVWSGFITGVGEDAEDRARGLEILSRYSPEALSILPFTPYPDTELVEAEPANPSEWARCLAAARLLFPSVSLFSDFSSGFYAAYASSAGVNGYYVFPAMEVRP